jgi:hypothetical protein
MSVSGGSGFGRILAYNGQDAGVRVRGASRQPAAELDRQAHRHGPGSAYVVSRRLAPIHQRQFGRGVRYGTTKSHGPARRTRDLSAHGSNPVGARIRERNCPPVHEARFGGRRSRSWHRARTSARYCRKARVVATKLVPCLMSVRRFHQASTLSLKR